MENLDEQLKDVALMMVKLAPPGWARLRLVYENILSKAASSVTVQFDNGIYAPYRFEDPNLALALNELRYNMYQPERGTWIGMVFTVDVEGGMEVHFNYDEPLTMLEIPDEFYVMEVRDSYPRSPENIPSWWPKDVSATLEELDRFELILTLDPEDLGKIESSFKAGCAARLNEVRTALERAGLPTRPGPEACILEIPLMSQGMETGWVSMVVGSRSIGWESTLIYGELGEDELTDQLSRMVASLFSTTGWEILTTSDSQVAPSLLTSGKVWSESLRMLMQGYRSTLPGSPERSSWWQRVFELSRQCSFYASSVFVSDDAEDLSSAFSALYGKSYPNSTEDKLGRWVTAFKRAMEEDPPS